ncbi:isochorismatase family cysteine hydrolase [Rhodovibrio salinarum]|uniref:Cysteine hydrolase n=1 Tax=Rhodovibrio salinarum TaxID=1087 RepID=A0A934QKB0_9PROT|nr:isochorismatase family cysteine hydrolase [Rhodovibrio salinarum]MBK1698482.1 cysteine hydrolase [Rhodovibrio salinarum]
MNDFITPQRAHAALLTVDAQRDYVNPESPVKSAGAYHALEPLSRLVHSVRESGMPIFHAVRFYKPDGSNVDLARRRAVEEGMRVLMPGSLGSDLIPEVAPENPPRLDPHLLQDGGVQELSRREEVFYKPRWGAFYRTPLEQRLHNLGINTLIIVGANFATSGRASVLEASERDFRVVMVPEACSGLRETGANDLARIGVSLMRLEECLAWSEGHHRPTQAA